MPQRMAPGPLPAGWLSAGQGPCHLLPLSAPQGVQCHSRWHQAPCLLAGSLLGRGLPPSATLSPAGGRVPHQMAPGPLPACWLSLALSLRGHSLAEGSSSGLFLRAPSGSDLSLAPSFSSSLSLSGSIPGSLSLALSPPLGLVPLWALLAPLWGLVPLCDLLAPLWARHVHPSGPNPASYLWCHSGPPPLRLCGPVLPPPSALPPPPPSF